MRGLLLVAALSCLGCPSGGGTPWDVEPTEANIGRTITVKGRVTRVITVSTTSWTLDVGRRDLFFYVNFQHVKGVGPPTPDPTQTVTVRGRLSRRGIEQGQQTVTLEDAQLIR